ncbi:hypothetical protein FOL47_010239, partial [Perkinsus chesapeaki]
MNSILFSVAICLLNVWAEEDWCKSHKAKEIHSLRKDLLPDDGIRLIDFAFDDFGNWFIAGEEKTTGIYRCWRMNYSENKSDIIFRGRAEAIDVFSPTLDATRVFAIVKNEIRMYGTHGNLIPPLEGKYRVIGRGGRNHKFTDLAFDKSSQRLFVSDKKTNQVYSYFPSRSGNTRRRAAGNRDGRAIDDETHLYRPRGVKIAGGNLYILQGPCEERRLVRWTPYQSKRTYKYDFQVEGRSGFEISDAMPDYIYYRSGGDAVYKGCANWSCNGPILIAGGCGRCHNDNQLVNRGSGALKMDQSGRLMIWDFGRNRFVTWEDMALNCLTSSCPPTTIVPGKVNWEEKISYNADGVSCKLVTTGNVVLYIIYGIGTWANCTGNFEEVGHLSSSLPMPGGHEDFASLVIDKQWCIDYFIKLGFTPGAPLDYARDAICDPRQFPNRTATTPPTVAEAPKWENRVVFHSERDVCELEIVASVELRVYPGVGAWADCGPLRPDENVSYILAGLQVPGAHDKQWCIEYFKRLGFVPGGSLDDVREAICGPDR